MDGGCVWHDFSNASFERPGGNFPKGPTAYCTPPDLTNPAAIPPVPGVARDYFRGPPVDATLGKAVGLPHLPILGENGKFDFRANFYNLVNQINFVPFNDQTIGTIVVTPAHGGRTRIADCGRARTPRSIKLPRRGRVIEGQVRFSF